MRAAGKREKLPEAEWAAIGTHRNYVALIERGKPVPTLAVVERLAPRWAPP